MKIITNNQQRRILDWFDLTEKERKEFDYLDENVYGFVRYKKQILYLGDFMYAPKDIQNIGWHGYCSDTFFSGSVIKIVGDDVVVGRYYT